MSTTPSSQADAPKRKKGVALAGVAAGTTAICRIKGSIHIPLGELPARLAEIPIDRPVLIHCHHGGRSLRATQFLRAKGRPDVSNVKGGIDAWSVEVDPSVARY